jgi:hypothetical protein
MYNFQKTRQGKPFTKQEKRKKNKSDYRYKKRTYKQINVKLRYDKCGDIIEHILKQESIPEYIAKLVKADIENNK